MDLQDPQKTSYQFGANGHYIEELYAQYLNDKNSDGEQ